MVEPFLNGGRANIRKVGWAATGEVGRGKFQIFAMRTILKKIKIPFVRLLAKRIGVGFRLHFGRSNFKYAIGHRRRI